MSRGSDERIRWVDLGVRGMEVVLADFAGSPEHRAIVVRGDVRLGASAERALAAAGFSRFDGPRTVWARPGSTFYKADLRPAFPHLRVVEVPFSRTRTQLRGASPFAPSLPAAAEEASETPVVEQAVTPAPAPPPVDEERRANSFQLPYAPASRVGTPIAMVPVNMAEATAKALARTEAEHGPMDDFVADLLKMTVLNMGKVLSPEQVDAVGMCIASIMRGRGFILADQTGLGKGRVLAAMALSARQLGRKVIFITEKANLFSDFWRDVVDIGAAEALGTPLLMNDKSKIIDMTSLNGDLLFEAPKTDVLRKIVRSGELPKGCSFMMSTYSQYNRVGTPKGNFLKAAADDALVIVDEAHNSIGDSNTAKCLDAALVGAWGTVRSSATFARTAKNLLSYSGVLPPSLRKDNPEDLLDAGGNALAEALSQYLAEDGVLIRREHDLSAIRIEVVMDDKRSEANRAYADALAPILSRMARLARVVNDEAEIRNEANKEGGDGASGGGRKGAKENWYTANFGSQLSPLIRQFVTAITLDLCFERCVEALLVGEKPVVVIESTMEALMRELVSDGSGKEGDEDGVPNEIEPEALDEALADKEGTRPPDFRAALRTMLDRLMTLSCKRPGVDDPERIPVEEPYAVAEAAGIATLIDAFPDLSLSPIDDIQDRIEAEGRRLHAAGVIDKPWKAGEISARRLRVRDCLYEVMPVQDRNATIVSFQSGPLDALVITGAASTGLSLHASERAADKRRRRMIEWQIPKNVVGRIQFWGRVNRRGQVSVPAFETLCSGLPLQMRIMAMENRKVEALSANVSASAANATAMDVPDLIDSVGNEVARRMLEDQPNLAEAMCIAMRVDPEQAEHELYFVNKLLQRMSLIPSSRADAVFAHLVSEYEDAIAALKAKGQTPRGNRELAGLWSEVSREPYEAGDPADGPVFGRAIDLVTMQAEIERAPLAAEDLRRIVSESRKRLGEASGRAAGPYFEGQSKDLKASRRRVLTSALSGRLISVDSALAMKGPNAVKSASERLDQLLGAISSIQPGIGIVAPGEEGEPVSGVVVDVRPPGKEELHLPGRWSVRYAVPGDAHPREISIATILRDKGYTLHPARPGEVPTPSLNAFDAAPRGGVIERRVFLDGNLVKSVAIASETSAGSLVAFTGEDGRRRRAILVSRRGRAALFDRSKSTTDAAEAIEVVTSGRAVWTHPTSKAEGVIVRPENGGGIVVEIPKGKAGKALETEALVRAAGTFRAIRDFRGVQATRQRLGNVIAALLADGHSLHFAPPPKPRPQSYAQRRAQGFARPAASSNP